MKFSILTCSYNNREGVLASMEAVRGQRSEGVEIEHIVIDGGSTDGTVEALGALRAEERSQKSEVGEGGQRSEVGSQESEFAAQTPQTQQPTPINQQLTTTNYHLKWLSEPDQGLYDALNKGLRMATGDVIGILHTDDVWEPGVLRRVAACMEHGAGSRGERGDDTWPLAPCPLPPDGVYGDLLYVDADDITKVRRVWLSGAYDAKKFDRGWMPPHPALFVRRELAERVGEYRLDLGSAADYEWMLRACRVHHAQLAHLPEVLVRMRVGGQSNASVKARLKANRNDRHAWELNGLTPRPWTLFLKPVRKLPQWMAAKLRWKGRY